jgi:hypothetical protein
MRHRRPSQRPMPSPRPRRGFALPMAILVIAVLTAGLAAGYAATTSEIATNTATRSQSRAYSIAQAGLESFMARRNESGWCTNCVADPVAAAVDSEWTRVTVPGGYADVVAIKVRPYVNPATPALFFIRSRGRDTAVKLSAGGLNVFAERTVGIYASWNTMTINVLAAWVSLSGLNKNGTGVISGVDQCGAKADVAGVTVPKGDLHVQGNSFEPAGSPPVDTSLTFGPLRDSVNIDWNGIVNNNAMTADVTVPPGTFPDDDWFDANPDSWPVIRIKTNGFSLPNRGRGTIIADSNFSISGSNMWDGIVLVGGQLTSNGNNTTAGATLSGLNFLLGGTPQTSSVDDSDANGQKTYVYNSCNVEKATQGLRTYVAMPNTWMDNVAAW